MTFYEMLEQVIALLQRHGRLSYRALKVQFELDDDRLDLLKEELIDIQHIARDQDGRMLVWTRGTEIPPVSASATSPLVQQAIAQHDFSTQAASPPAPHSPDAERRQLTVMFCDLVDSTALSRQLDPEDLREVIQAYQRVCTEVINRFDGHIAQYLGDGLLVYFGYPQAHEDDPQRAVYTGLGILDAMGDLNKRLEQDRDITLALRLGIHTGLVVVGSMGGGGRQEQLALGETPNLAARLQGLAASNMVVISEATHRLVQGYFAYQDLGAQELRGIPESMCVYHVLRESGATSRLDIAQHRGLTPLVGREQEVGLLEERWQQAKSGHGHVVLLSGDAGIGKSRLVQMLKEHIAHEPHMRWECRSAEYSQNTALFPLVELFQRLLRFEASETPDVKLEKLEHALSQYRVPLEESVQFFAPLLSLPLPENHYPPLHLSPQRQRQKTLDTIVAILQEHAERHPVLFIVEDLHWTDPSTLELLNLVVEQIPTTSILTVLTCRPHFQPAWHHRSYMTEMTVNRLAQPQIEHMITQVAGGKTFPHAVMQQIVERTDGVPLFVEELTKAIVESGHLKDVDGHYELTGSLSTVAIPATLQDSLMARLDRLMTGKVIAQIGATIGRQFSYALLQAASQLSARTLHEELHRLVEAELLYQRGVPPQATYTFKHALIQDAAYESLLKSTRQQYHQRIAQVLESQFPETVEAQPELLAHHYTEAGLAEKAVHYWYHAGQSAVQRSAHVEAISHLRTGLVLLQTLPKTTDRVQREVDMYIALGASLSATKGNAAPEVGQTYTYAQQLCEPLDDPHQLFPIVRGLWNYYQVRAEYQTAHALGEQLLTLAQHTQHPGMLLAAYRAVGTTFFYLGGAVSALTHLMHGLALYNPQQHRASVFLYGDDAGVVCCSHAAWTLWYLGYPERGLARSQEAVNLAQQSPHPLSLSHILCAAARFHQFRREVPAVQEHAEATIRVAQEQGFPYWMAIGSVLCGWTRAQQGQVQEGIEQIHQGLRAYRATGAESWRPYGLALLAEAHGTIGELEAGLTALAEALTLVETTGERWYKSEMYRLKGELLLQQNSDHQAEAEICFHYALEIARNHQAKSFELRVATTMARLWQQQGKRQEAHDLLAPVYHWFTEGFDTADLKDAKALLDELA
jgi:class 3 adenylate cyclase/predicted ATPase